jgi:hypothetical protein
MYVGPIQWANPKLLPLSARRSWYPHLYRTSCLSWLGLYSHPISFLGPSTKTKEDDNANSSLITYISIRNKHQLRCMTQKNF